MDMRAPDTSSKSRDAEDVTELRNRLFELGEIGRRTDDELTAERFRRLVALDQLEARRVQLEHLESTSAALRAEHDSMEQQLTDTRHELADVQRELADVRAGLVVTEQALAHAEGVLARRLRARVGRRLRRHPRLAGAIDKVRRRGGTDGG
jgi:septal ring factor EnvC (AmiA/AmiB activator)